MARKLGEGRLPKQIELGWREVQSPFFTDSNAQPAYPNRDAYETPTTDDREASTLDKRLERVGQSRDDRDRDDRDKGIDRE
jgi:hypothetical protein